MYFLLSLPLIRRDKGAEREGRLREVCTHSFTQLRKAIPSTQPIYAGSQDITVENKLVSQ